MSATAELTLGRSSEFVKSVAFAAEQLERIRRLEQYLEALEDERKKVEAFKRELPFCLQLLSHAIQVSKEQLADCQFPPPKRQGCFEDGSNKKGRRILEDFIPLKNHSDNSTFKDGRENRAPEHTKSSGLIQTKYWSQEQAYAHGEEIISSMAEKPSNNRGTLQAVAEPILGSRRVSGAFLPFSRDRMAPSAFRAASTAELPDLSLRVEDGEDCSHGDVADIPISSRGGSSEGAIHQSKDTPIAAGSNSSGQAYSPPQRKARRCWSPELHRQFVNALQQLGGSQVATPKQIRELMKVEGLTNDEVKSHLQKYRLHTRRPVSNAGFQSAAPHAPQLVVLGGIWVPEYVAHAATADATRQGPPSLYNPAQQATHSHSPDNYTQLNSTSQLQQRSSLYYDDHQQEATATHDHSQGSSRAGPLQLTGHPSDAGREESMEEDPNEGSSWKDEIQDQRILEADVPEDSNERNFRAHKWKYCRDSREEDSEAEESRAYAIAV